MEHLALWLSSNMRWLKSQLMRRGRTCEEAEDLIQEAYLRVHEFCEHGGEAREPEKVLVRTVMRLSMNAVRDHNRHPRTDRSVEELGLIDPAPSAEERLAAEKGLQCISSALDALPVRTREAFLLRRMEGLSYADIAKRLGVSISAVEKHVGRAMSALMEAVARDRGLP
jgi:RNA polymerase sigma factor (sigma-70 family)